MEMVGRWPGPGPGREDVVHGEGLAMAISDALRVERPGDARIELEWTGGEG